MSRKVCHRFTTNLRDPMSQRSMFSAKSCEEVIAGGDAGEHKLKRALGSWNLIALGIGAIIGAGLFSLTGVAAADNAGPAIVLSFMLAAVGCALAGMCYSEMASMIPISGSAYTYAQATMGELAAWTIGWALVLEYALGAATVSVSWSAYVMDLFNSLGVPISTKVALQPLIGVPLTLDFGAIFIVVVVSMILIRGISESAMVNNIIVIVKVSIVLAVVAVGVFYIKPANYVPFVPPNTGTFGEFGISGIFRAAGVIFFAYIGFDAVSTASQEARNPQRDIPIGILGSLVVCTILYILVSTVLTGLVSYRSLDVSDPVAMGIDVTGITWGSLLVKIGAVFGLGTVMLVMLLGQSRVFYSMSKDGLLWKWASAVHPKFRTPWISNTVVGTIVAFLPALLPIDKLAALVNMGTLLAFTIVCAGVWILRRRHPTMPRPFKTPLVPLVPILGICSAFYLMIKLPLLTWEVLVIWLIVGLGIYFGYSIKHSKVQAMSPAETTGRKR